MQQIGSHGSKLLSAGLGAVVTAAALQHRNQLNLESRVLRHCNELRQKDEIIKSLQEKNTLLVRDNANSERIVSLYHRFYAITLGRGYDLMSPEQKKAAGLLRGVKEANTILNAAMKCATNTKP